MLCDTSFVGVSAKRAADPDAFAWPHAVIKRLDNAILAVSVIILAGARFV
jgi:hypothetical protein